MENKIIQNFEKINSNLKSDHFIQEDVSKVKNLEKAVSFSKEQENQSEEMEQIEQAKQNFDKMEDIQDGSHFNRNDQNTLENGTNDHNYEDYPMDNREDVNWSRRFTNDPPDLSNVEKYYPNMPAHYQKSVIVSNISPKLTIHQLKTFFSFCGKIERIGLSNGNYIGFSVLNATDVFDNESTLNESKVEVRYFTEHAANTACLLDQTQLLGSYIGIRKKSERQIHPLSESEYESFLDEYKIEDDELNEDNENQDLKPTDIPLFVDNIKKHECKFKRSFYSTYANTQSEALENSIYVGNLHGRITESEFVSIMAICGPVVNYQLAGEFSHSTRFGFIQYLHREDRELALKFMNGFNFMGNPLKVNACKKPISHSYINLTKEESKNFSIALSKLQEKLKIYTKKQDRGKSPPRGRNLSPHSSRRSPTPNMYDVPSYSNYYEPKRSSSVSRNTDSSYYSDRSYDYSRNDSREYSRSGWRDSYDSNPRRDSHRHTSPHRSYPSSKNESLPYRGSSSNGDTRNLRDGRSSHNSNYEKDLPSKRPSRNDNYYRENRESKRGRY